MTVTSASAMRKCAKVSQTRYESRLVGENGLKPVYRKEEEKTQFSNRVGRSGKPDPNRIFPPVGPTSPVTKLRLYHVSNQCTY